jgi:hypothetical protein
MTWTARTPVQGILFGGCDSETFDSSKPLVKNEFRVSDLVAGRHAPIKYAENLEIYAIPHVIRPLLLQLHVLPKMISVYVISQRVLFLTDDSYTIDRYRNPSFWGVIRVFNKLPVRTLVMIPCGQFISAVIPVYIFAGVATIVGCLMTFNPHRMELLAQLSLLILNYSQVIRITRLALFVSMS